MYNIKRGKSWTDHRAAIRGVLKDQSQIYDRQVYILIKALLIVLVVTLAVAILMPLSVSLIITTLSAIIINSLSSQLSQLKQLKSMIDDSLI